MQRLGEPPEHQTLQTLPLLALLAHLWLSWGLWRKARAMVLSRCWRWTMPVVWWEVEFLNGHTVHRGSSSSAADERGSSAGSQTLRTHLISSTHKTRPCGQLLPPGCVQAPHDGGVEQTQRGRGPRPSTANKKFTDLQPLAEQRPDLPAVSPAHRLHLTFFFSLSCLTANR